MMYRRNILQFILGAIGVVSTKSGLTPSKISPRKSIVGAWHLQSVGAPILHHGFLFHSDRTVCSFQADGGYPSGSMQRGAS